MSMIEVSSVTMDYRIQKERVNSIKEYLVRTLKRQITYENFRAVEDASFTIDKGEICGIIGRNGAGKSTLLKLIAGVLTPTSGSIRVNGSIAPMLELGTGFDLDLNAKENIFLNGAILGYSKDFLQRRYQEIVDFSELHEFMGQPLRTFSSGMLMRLAFAIATLVEPEVLIVDEILAVGDSRFQKKSAERMQNLMKSGTDVLMVSHSTLQIRELCSRDIWLDKAKIIMDGEPDSVCEAYEQ